MNRPTIPSVDDTAHSRAVITRHKSPDTSSGQTEQNHCLRLGTFLQVAKRSWGAKLCYGSLQRSQW